MLNGFSKRRNRYILIRQRGVFAMNRQKLAAESKKIVGYEEKYAKQNNSVTVEQHVDKWQGFLKSLDMFSEDFLKDGREQGDNQIRESM